MKCLRSMWSVTKIDKFINEEIRGGVGLQNCVERWFGHVERMDDSGVQGRPTRVWMDGVKEAVTNGWLTLELARLTVHYIAE